MSKSDRIIALVGIAVDIVSIGIEILFKLVF